MIKQKIYNTVDAKAHLNELLNAVVSGQEILIQKRGKIVAKLSKASEEKQTAQLHKDVFKRLRAFHKKVESQHGKKSQTLDILREIRKEAK